MVVAAVVSREQDFRVLGGQACAQRLVVAQHRRQVLGLLAQLLHLLSQGGVLLLQVLAFLGRRKPGHLSGGGERTASAQRSPAWLARLRLGILKPVHRNIPAVFNKLPSNASSTIQQETHGCRRELSRPVVAPARFACWFQTLHVGVFRFHSVAASFPKVQD